MTEKTRRENEGRPNLAHGDQEKEGQVGSALHLNEPPLPIPPPGFIEANGNGDRRKRN